MSGAIPPLPQYAFMAWCLEKAQGQLYIYLVLSISKKYRTHCSSLKSAKTDKNRNLKPPNVYGTKIFAKLHGK
jgi:hypothetical protein